MLADHFSKFQHRMLDQPQLNQPRYDRLVHWVVLHQKNLLPVSLGYLSAMSIRSDPCAVRT